MNFNFANWHLVPEDATIPAGTPFWRYISGEDEGRYYGRGVDYDLGLAERWSDDDYYTEERILDPGVAVIEQRAQKMFRTFWGSLEYQWEYDDVFVQDKWRNLAAKYVEKEAD